MKDKKIDVFISYSHKSSINAASIQEGLQKLANPWWKLRAIKAFRDETDLEATPDGWSSLCKALDNSRYFLLLATEDAANSKWVKREIHYFLTDGKDSEQHIFSNDVKLNNLNASKRDKLLILLLDGEMKWNDSGENQKSFDWLKTTSIPKILDGFYQREPFLSDLRSVLETVSENKKMDKNNPDFIKAIAKTSAPIRNVDYNRLISNDYKIRKKNIALAWSASIILSLLLGVAIWLFILANNRKQEADERALEARSQQLASEAQLRIASIDGLPEEGVLLGIESLSLKYSPQGFDAFLKGYSKLPNIDSLRNYDSAIKNIFISQNIFAFLNIENKLTILNTTDNKEIVFDYDDSIIDVKFDSNLLYVIGSKSVSVINLMDFTEIYKSKIDYRIQKAIYNTNNGFLTLQTNSNKIIIIKSKNEFIQELIEFKHVIGGMDYTASSNLIAIALDKNPDTTKFANSSYAHIKGLSALLNKADAELKILDLNSGSISKTLSLEESPSTVKFSSNGEYLAVGTTMGNTYVYSTKTWENISKLENRRRVIKNIQFINNNKIAISNESGTIAIYALSNGEIINTLRHRGLVKDLIYDPYSNNLVSLTIDSVAYGWNLNVQNSLYSERSELESYKIKESGITSINLNKGKVVMGTTHGRIYFTSFKENLPFTTLDKLALPSANNNNLVISSSKNELAYTSNHNNKIFDLKDSTITKTPFSTAINCFTPLHVTFSKKEQYHLTSSLGCIYLRSLEDIKTSTNLVKNLDTQDWYLSEFTNNDYEIVGISNLGISMWQKTSNQELDSLYEYKKTIKIGFPINTISSHPVLPIFAIGGEKLMIFSTPDLEEKLNRDLNETITSLTFSKDGNFLYLGTYSGKILKMDTQGWNVLESDQRHEDSINDIAISDDGNFMVSSSFNIDFHEKSGKDKSVKLWDISQRKEIFRIKVRLPTPVEFGIEHDIIMLNNGKLQILEWDIKSLSDFIKKRYSIELSTDLKKQLGLK